MSVVTYGTSLGFMQGLGLEEALGKVADAGFKQVELICNGLAFDGWWNDPEPLRRALARHGLRARSVHSPYTGWNNDAIGDAERRRSVDMASAVFAPAASLGVNVVVCHPNVPSAPVEGAAWEAAFARSVESLTTLGERAREAGIRIAVENMPILDIPRPGGRVEELLRMIDGLGVHVGIWVDAGHANANGIDASDEVRTAGRKLLGVHLQDNDGNGGDQHLVPGTGTVNWPRFLAALNDTVPDAIRSFEVSASDGGIDATLDSLAELCRNWERS